MRRRHFLTLAGGTGAAMALAPPGTAAAVPGADGLVRNDLRVRGPGGARVFVREVRPAGTAGRVGRPLLLVHGARPGGTAAFDLPVRGGSLAAELAAAGYAVYVMDVRGFGYSDYPAEMGQDPAAHPPLVRSAEAVVDIGTVVRLIRARRGRWPAAFGWATGGHWLAMYAAVCPDRLTHLVLLNSLYSVAGPWPLQQELEDPDRPGHPRPQPAWRAVTADSLTARWDAGPADEPAGPRRDPVVRHAYRAAALRADPTSHTRTPPSFRNPTGPLVDAFHLAQGRQFYDAGRIRARTLVLRAELDFWSRPQDGERLAADLTRADAVRVRTLSGASHFLHLERAPYGRGELLEEIRTFVPSNGPIGGGSRKTVPE
ncbi:alpha/beta fold hydrolase [Streptomyces bluensis]|uniref:alpha/beta fold hydrolase n=1 Tax=Streptomyces bluensis TaxID=33897 RepID=UPI0016746890|nr:alpha/beta fold hydrolase [Streptomyces bluensis]GGZ63888.1 alpha/beta hydrolase [Streptomyces bluensis]